MRSTVEGVAIKGGLVNFRVGVRWDYLEGGFDGVQGGGLSGKRVYGGQVVQVFTGD